MGGLVDQLLTDSITTRHLGPDDLLFATRDGTAVSRNTSRTRIWLPAANASGVGFDVRVHDCADVGIGTTCATPPRPGSGPGFSPAAQTWRP